MDPVTLIECRLRLLLRSIKGTDELISFAPELHVKWPFYVVQGSFAVLCFPDEPAGVLPLGVLDVVPFGI